MKFLTSLIAGLALVLSALIAPPAASATNYSHKHHHKHHHHKHHPYAGSVKTESHYYTQSSVKKGQKVGTVYNVEAQGNAKPKGTVVIKVYYVKDGKSYLVKTISKNYVGPHLKKQSLGSFSKTGLYKTTLTFVPAKGSVYTPSSNGPNYFYVK